MNDIELIRKCAEKMGLKTLTVLNGVYVERPDKEVDYIHDGVYEYDGTSNMWSRRYSPIYNDAQAMQLVKKFRLMIWTETAYWLVADSECEDRYRASNTDLNRAIVACVASLP